LEYVWGKNVCTLKGNWGIYINKIVMREILFAFILFTFSLIPNHKLNAQSFGEIGTEWYYSEHAGGACVGNCEYIHFKSVKDTIINQKITNKVTQTYYRYAGDTVTLTPLYVYETNDTVFMWSFQKSRFLVTYIFNAETGDTLTLDVPIETTNDATYRLIIDSIHNQTMDGVVLRKYYTTALDDFQFYNDGCYMDRIGGLGWLLPRTVSIPEAAGPIRCYSDSQIDVNFQDIPCDYIQYNSKEEFKKNVINVYPNPVNDFIKIDTKQVVKKINLYDITGNLILTTTKMNVDLSNLLFGEYIIEIYLKSGDIVLRKIIKK
jgi:hypothetical protein